MATKTFRLILITIGSEMLHFFVAFVLLLQYRLFGLYFVPQASKRVEIAWEGFSEAQEAYKPRKIYLGAIFREKWRSNLSQISPEATQEPEEQGLTQLWAAQCHVQGRAAQTARGPGLFGTRGAQTGADGPVQIRILCYITCDYAHTIL